MNNQFSIELTRWIAAESELKMLRTLVFIDEQHVSAEEEWDGNDEAAIHFLVRNKQGDALGCARLLIEQKLLHIGRVAVLRNYRQQGIGHQLMKHIIEWGAQHHPDFAVYLHAQTSRITFYERLGFVSQGDIFIDANIPHIEMWLHV